MTRATERRQLRLQGFDFGPLDELTMRQYPGNRVVDCTPQSPSLRGYIDKRDRTLGHAHRLVHRGFAVRLRLVQPARRRGVLRSAKLEGSGRTLRQRIAISRLATPSSPVTAGVRPLRIESMKAS